MAKLQTNLPFYASSCRALRGWKFTMLAAAICCLMFSSLPSRVAIADDPAIDPFRANVRPTQPLTPAEQTKKFHLPDGFQIELVAAEPRIYKPMNMAFDAAGRLWVSESREYPYAAPEGKGRDRIQILEDSNGDGRLDKTTTFVDGLNIPIGLLPYGEGVIAYSIPNIYYFRDTDGDGRCDRREILYGPLGQPRDTHGMQNAFRRGFDGWIYVCHGFSNESTIKARDGSSITLQSGNTYRIRPDGSRVEQFTWGQVNPFGSTWTPWGDLITADCHSKPLTLLLRGGYYSSFGKPHDGLGFTPALMDHLHGSTAIAGAAYYTGANFPAKYQGRLFVGNVVTSRVNSDRLQFKGATPRAIEEADFIKCDDPWFRPVDIQVAPDGSLFIADFYNRIIGHYEVPLDHPGRDRERGRIWRVSYRPHSPSAKNDAPKRLKRLDLASADQLIHSIDSTNLKQDLLAIDQLSDRIGPSCESAVRKTLFDRNANASKRTAMLWVLYRLDLLEDTDLKLASRDADSGLRLHAMRAISEMPKLSEIRFEIALAGLQDPAPLVRRNAADALGRQENIAALKPLLKFVAEVDQADVHLRRTAQIACRDLLKKPGAYRTLALDSLNSRQLATLAEISLATSTAESALFLLDYVGQNELSNQKAAAYLIHVSSHLPVERFDDFVGLVRKRFADQAGLQHTLLLAIRSKLAARDEAPMPIVKDWARQLAADWLRRAELPRDWRVVGGDACWDVEIRRCQDGKQVAFLSSLPGGEKARSVLRSKTFSMPSQLSFFICGHLGFPDKPADNRNSVVLRTADGRELARVRPPRNDVARKVEWSLPQHTGEQVYVEIVDQCDLNAYAWLAVARFEPPLLKIPELGRREFAKQVVTAAQVAAAFELKELAAPLGRMSIQPNLDLPVRTAAAIAHAQLKRNYLGESLARIAADGRTPPVWKTRLIQKAVSQEPATELLVEFMRAASAPLQRSSAIALCSTQAGAETLLNLVEQGAASRRLLQDRGVTQRLIALKQERLNRRALALTAGLSPPNIEIQKKVAALVASSRSQPGHRENGRKLFEKHCQACHQVAGKGAKIGPQLDGVGNRGLSRVAEDLLDPNRNVDATFRVVSLAMEDGRVVSGLKRRMEGRLFVLADEKGKEFTVDPDQVQESKQTLNSLMPSNFAEQLKPAELRDLLAYLSALRAKSKAEE